MDSFLPVEETFKPQRTGATEYHSTPYSAFMSYWDDVILQHIVQETNRTASNTFRKKWVPTNIHEILVLFSFWMMLGIVRMPSYKSCFSTSPLLETTVFRRMFTRKRYEDLVRALHFVDSPTEEVFPNGDRIHRIRPILTHLNMKFQANYTPSKDICIDESLIMWKGRFDIRQYIRAKSAKKGIKTFELCESATGYLWSFLVYSGKNSSFDTGRYSGLKKSTEVVLTLMKPLLNKGYRLFLDNWFTSPLLCRFLKHNATDCVGTLRPNRQHVPPLIDLCKLEQGQVVGRHSGDVCVMAWQDKKKVTTISTCHGIAQGLATVSSAPSKQSFKPQVVLDYKKYMGGVDLKDQMLEPYPLERKRCTDWHMKLFKWLLNCSILNARILVQSSTGQHQDHSDFRLGLVDAILSTHLPLCPVSRQRARKARYNLPPSTRNPHLESHWLIRVAQTPRDAELGRQSRKNCHWCTRAGRKNHKTAYRCEQCDVPLCVEGCSKFYHLSS
ncbi:hypothetical protein ABMA28_010943 [Loxostege sticticalis]|uniref:Transposase n=1 Tax=Loxostege sticticalis TaxID=481309 RepID=A0ABD0SBQ2_LOXSC